MNHPHPTVIVTGANNRRKGKMDIRIGLIVSTLSAVVLFAPVPAAAEAYMPDVKTNLIVFPVTVDGKVLQGVGRLQVPLAPEHGVPAVVIVHGTGGMDAKGPMYAQDLNAIGIATLEIDLWGPRGLAGGWDGRPKHVNETLPDAFAALHFLAGHPRIDNARIGIMGFSWGGVVSMLTATEPYVRALSPDGVRFAAHAPFYPICFAYNRIPGYEFKLLTGAPVAIFTGADDKYDADPGMCPQLVAGLPVDFRAKVRVTVYPGAEHGFNNLDQPRTYLDPYHFQGKGGIGASTPNPVAREASREAVVTFFRESLAR